MPKLGDGRGRDFSLADAAGTELSSWLEELHELYGGEMLRMCVVMSGDPELAGDAVQNSWLIALRKLPGLRDRGRVRGWLLTVAANELRRLIRRRRIGFAALGRLAGPQAPAPFSDPDLHDALTRLDPQDRQLLALDFVLGLSSGEIGEVIGLSAAGVRTRKARVLERLRKELDGG